MYEYFVDGILLREREAPKPNQIQCTVLEYYSTILLIIIWCIFKLLLYFRLQFSFPPSLHFKEFCRRTKEQAGLITVPLFESTKTIYDYAVRYSYCNWLRCAAYLSGIWWQMYSEYCTVQHISDARVVFLQRYRPTEELFFFQLTRTQVSQLMKKNPTYHPNWALCTYVHECILTSGPCAVSSFNDTLDIAFL
jgi:hypothetical protein